MIDTRISAEAGQAEQADRLVEGHVPVARLEGPGPLPRSRNSTRMPESTHRVIRTRIARGTTRVMIADSTVATTISVPATKASHAGTVVPTASLPPPALCRGR